MDITGSAGFQMTGSEHRLNHQNARQQAQIEVFKDARDSQGQAIMQLMEAIPEGPKSVKSADPQMGSNIDIRV